MKTPEQMAAEHVKKVWQDSGTEFERMACECDFLAGYRAAKDNQEYLMNEMSILRSRLDTAEKLSQLVDEEKEQ